MINELLQAIMRANHNYISKTINSPNFVQDLLNENLDKVHEFINLAIKIGDQYTLSALFNEDLLKAIIEKGLDLNKKDKDGNTILMNLIKKKYFWHYNKILDIDSIEKRLNLLTVNNDNQNVFQLASELMNDSESIPTAINLINKLIRMIDSKKFPEALGTRPLAGKGTAAILSIMRNMNLLRVIFNRIPLEQREKIISQLLLIRDEKNRYSMLVDSDPFEFNQLLSVLAKLDYSENKELKEKKVQKELPTTESNLAKKIMLKAILSEDSPKDNLIMSLVLKGQNHKLNFLLKYLDLPALPNKAITQGKVGILKFMGEQFPKLKPVFESKALLEERVEKTGIHEIYVGGEADAIKLRFDKSRKKQQEEIEPKLIYGPLAKNKFTEALESLVSYALQNVPITVEKDINEEPIASVSIGGKKETYNLATLLKHANYQHIKLLTKDLNRYQDYAKSRVSEKTFKFLASEEEIRKQDEDKNLSDVSYPEMFGIHLYSGDMYSQINAVLRGEFHKVKPEDIIVLLVHSTVAVSGLNKIPDSIVNTAYRVETVGDDPGNIAKRETRLKEIEKGGGVTQERGFVSSSFAKPSEDWVPTGDTYITFQGIPGEDGLSGGLIGKNIHLISPLPDEREFLIPPTQVLWTAHIREGNKDYFYARPVRILNDLTPEAMEMEENIPLKVSNKLNIDLHIFLESILHLKNSLIEKQTSRKNIDLIHSLVSFAAKIVQNDEIDPFQKLWLLTGELRTVKCALPESERGDTNLQKQFMRLFEKQTHLLDQISLQYNANIHTAKIIELARSLQKHYQLQPIEIKNLENCVINAKKIMNDLDSSNTEHMKQLQHLAQYMQMQANSILNRNKKWSMRKINKTILNEFTQLLGESKNLVITARNIDLKNQTLSLDEYGSRPLSQQPLAKESLAKEALAKQQSSGSKNVISRAKSHKRSSINPGLRLQYESLKGKITTESKNEVNKSSKSNPKKKK